MNQKIIFSPTSGTDKCVNSLLGAFSESLNTIDLMMPDYKGESFTIHKEDICFVGVPSYGGRMPELCQRRLQELKGNGAIAIATVVYGNRAQEDTLLELVNTLNHCGFKVIAGVTAIAQHSIAPNTAHGRPDKNDQDLLNDFSAQIKKKIDSGDFNNAKDIPGNDPYKERSSMHIKIHVNNNCMKCGHCAEVCPVKAISLNDLSATDSTCINCMRCISECPVHARTLDAKMAFMVETMLKVAASKRKEPKLYL